MKSSFPQTQWWRLDQIQMRDPFVLPVPEERRYYLLGTTDKWCWSGPGTGFDAYVSADLEWWEGPLPAFRPSAQFWADTNFWAPEVHRYGGRFFMLASFKRAGVCRGTQVLAADHPAGPFVPHSDGPVTPCDWECLDGTLFLDDGEPWLVYCHEWTQVRDGAIYAQRLAPDLRQARGRPVRLFSASEAPWVVKGPAGNGFVTDGPFLFRDDDGRLHLLWSSYGPHGYAVGAAVSAYGGIGGPWFHEPAPLFDRDGGHGMVFRAFGGEQYLALHRPNDTPNERPVLWPLRKAADGGFSLERPDCQGASDARENPNVEPAKPQTVH